MLPGNPMKAEQNYYLTHKLSCTFDPASVGKLAAEGVKHVDLFLYFAGERSIAGDRSISAEGPIG